MNLRSAIFSMMLSIVAGSVPMVSYADQRAIAATQTSAAQTPGSNHSTEPGSVAQPLSDGRSQVASDGADWVGARRVASDGADHVGARRVASDGADRVGANRVASDGADRVGANRVASDGADRVGANRVADIGSYDTGSNLVTSPYFCGPCR